MKTLTEEEFNELIGDIIKAGTFKYDGYLAVRKEKEKPKEPVEPPLDMNKLYMWGGKLVEIVDFNGDSYKVRYVDDCEMVWTTRHWLISATPDQIKEIYGFRVGGETGVWYEDIDGFMAFEGYASWFDACKAVFKAAGVKFIPSKYWKNMEENDGA